MTIKKVVDEAKAEAKHVDEEVKAAIKKEKPVVLAEVAKVEAEAKVIEAEVEAEAEVVVQAVRDFTWADFEGMVCPQADGTIPGHHSLMWHGVDTPQEVLNEMGAIFLH